MHLFVDVGPPGTRGFCFLASGAFRILDEKVLHNRSIIIDKVALIAEFKYSVGDDPLNDTKPEFDRTEAQDSDKSARM